MPGVARQVLDEFERDLAEVQKDEAIVWRLGALALMAGAVLVGAIAAAGVLACLARWWDRTRHEPGTAASAVPGAGGQ
jgi:hypothetical protein